VDDHLAALVALMAALAAYHRLPSRARRSTPAGDVPRAQVAAADATTGTAEPAPSFFSVFASFFQRPRIVAILAFLMLYRFAEAQLVKLVTPFLLDARADGGLGLTTSEVGVAYGTVGVLALTGGGLFGGWLASRYGLRRLLWVFVIAIHLPDAIFVWLAYTQPSNLTLISAAVAVEQFGYGFGFTAYILFMMMVARGAQQTAHYAICTGFMALGMMLLGCLPARCRRSWAIRTSSCGCCSRPSRVHRRGARPNRWGLREEGREGGRSWASGHQLRTAGGALPRLLEQPLSLGGVHQSAVEHDGVHLLRVGDVAQRIGVEDDEVGHLARGHGA
jgi:hypothetical protein